MRFLLRRNDKSLSRNDKSECRNEETIEYKKSQTN